MRQKKFFYIYIIITLFVGESILQFFNLDLKSEGIIGNSHYIALPVLFISVILNRHKMVFTDIDKKLIALMLIIGIVKVLFLRKSVGLSGFLNFIIEPILLSSMLKLQNGKLLSICRNLIVIFFIIECGIAIFEAVSKTILFAKLNDYDYTTLTSDMRAYSLHGHPLQNAFLVSIISSVILSSKMKITYRYALFFLGYLAVFSFNTRSSIYILAIILIVNVYFDIKNNRIKGGQKFIFLIGLFVAILLSVKYIESHSLGSRLATGLTKDDGSSYARFVLVDIIESMNLRDLLFGVSNEYILNVMDRNGLVAIENSIVNLIFGNGLIFTLIFLYLMFFKLKSIGNDKYMFNTVLFVTFLLLNANNALSTICPIIPILILTLYAFKELVPKYMK